jgi:hypothetical protein
MQQAVGRMPIHETEAEISAAAAAITSLIGDLRDRGVTVTVCGLPILINLTPKKP